MAFTVEDGTGLEDANAYCDVAFVDAHHADRGRTDWHGDSEAKQQAIIRATDYIEQRWGRRYKGVLKTTEQALGWPRSGAYVSSLELTGIPVALKKAVAEYALRALTARLMPDPVVSDDSGRRIHSKTEVVGPVEETVVYEAGGAVDAIRAYPEADLLMRPLIVSGGSLERA